MSLKDAVNSTLRRATGYQLTRETSEQRTAAIEEATRAGVRRAEERARQAAEEQRRRRAEERREAEAAKAARAARGEDLPRHLDEATRATIARVRPRTMTNVPELAALVEAVRYIERVGVPGQVVECGVWRGGSMQAAALTLLELGSTTRELHLFDTFEGMPAPSDVDVRVIDGVSASDLMEVSEKDANIWAYADRADVQQAMAEVPYPAELIHLHEGLVEDTVPAQAPDAIALLRLDTDWYASTRHELEHLYGRLSPGGVLIIDDYRAWEGSGRATDEWLAATAEPIFLAPMGPGRVAVKPLGSQG